MTPVATARVLIRNLESDTLRLHFSDFFIDYLHQSCRRKLDYARKFFPGAVFDELGSRVGICRDSYPLASAPSGFGAIPFLIEDLLLSLRLYRPGDLAFAQLHDMKGMDSHQQLSTP